MKNYKILINLIILLLLSTNTFNANAQNKEVSQNFLMNKKWKMSELTDKIIEDGYNQTELKFYYNGKLLGESFYYLSNEIDTIFDESKVGKISSGMYIISKVKHAENDNFTVLEVISATEKELILRNIKQTQYLKYELN